MTAKTDKTSETNDRPKVRFEIGGKAIDLNEVNRLARRLLEVQATKYAKKYAHLTGPEGEKPTVIIRTPRIMDRNIHVVLEYPEAMKNAVKGHSKATKVA